MQTASGKRDKQLIIQNPDGPAIPDGDGGYSQPFAAIASVFGAVEPATARGLERFRSNTVIATASHIISIPFIPGVSTESRVLFRNRVLNVRGFANPEERNIELILACEEIAVPTVSDSTPPDPGPSWMQSGWTQP